MMNLRDDVINMLKQNVCEYVDEWSGSPDEIADAIIKLVEGVVGEPMEIQPEDNFDCELCDQSISSYEIGWNKHRDKVLKNIKGE